MVDTQALVIPPLFEGTLGDYPTLPTVERPTASDAAFSHQKPADFDAFHDHKPTDFDAFSAQKLAVPSTVTFSLAVYIFYSGDLGPSRAYSSSALGFTLLQTSLGYVVGRLMCVSIGPVPATRRN